MWFYARPAIGPDGRLYSTSHDHPINPLSLDVVAWDPHTTEGDPDWVTVASPSCFAFSVPSVANDGTLLVTCESASDQIPTLVAMDPADGEVLFERDQCVGATRAGPASYDRVSDSGFLGEATLCAVELSTQALEVVGSSQFTYSTGRILDAPGNRYVGTSGPFPLREGDLQAFKVDGSADWSVTFAPGDGAPAVEAASDGRLFLSQSEVGHRLHARRAADGFIDRSFRAQEDLRYPVLDEEGNLYASRVSMAAVVALSSAGEPRWEVDFSGSGGPYAYVDLVAAGGVVIVRTGNRLYALDSSTGEPLWSEPFVAAGSITAPAVLDEHGHLVLIDSTRNHYLLDTGLTYAPSDWPVGFWGTPRNTLQEAF